jgi:hypothetical protein
MEIVRRIVARLQEADAELIKVLLANGCNVKNVKNGAIIISLPRLEQVEDAYVIPEELLGKGVQFALDISECGGNGDAVVVCGITGKQFRPYFVPDETTCLTCNSSQAYFTIPKCAITVRVNDKVEILQHMVTIRENVAYLQTSQIFKGPVVATKWRCPKCDRTLWAKEKGHMSYRGEGYCTAPLKIDQTNLSGNLVRLQPAVIAGLEKKDCQNCTHVHFGDIDDVAAMIF